MRALVLILLLMAATSVRAAEEKIGRTDPMTIAAREFEQEHFDAALAALAEKEQAETTAKTLDLKGRIYLEQGKYDQALAAFEDSTRADEKSPSKMHIGDMLMRQKNYEQARNVYREAIKLTNILMNNEKLRYGILVSSLAAEDEEEARAAFEALTFPTESAAYYYGQAAWAFAHGDKTAAEKWLERADGFFPAKSTSWFARPLYDLGWIKKKPPLSFTE
jgi:tetratricopeptide (TPR) repeat protein